MNLYLRKGRGEGGEGGGGGGGGGGGDIPEYPEKKQPDNQSEHRYQFSF